MLYSTLVKNVFRWIYGEPPEVSADRADAGLVLVADGVGGLNLLGTSLRTVAPKAGMPHAVRVVLWGHGFGRWHSDLTNVENHAAQAAALAAEVEEFRARKPTAPVFLIGKSGGAGVVIQTLEKLPENSVELAVLLAPALSPSYDLTRALEAVRRELVVFWSPLDVFVLGIGTWIFGTVDRVRSVSAGLVGFRPPQPCDEPEQRQYAKLHQIRWHPRMAATGYFGGHVGPDCPAFVRKYVVPLLTTPEGPADLEQCQAGSTEGR